MMLGAVVRRFCRWIGRLELRGSAGEEPGPGEPPLFVVGAPRSGTTAVYLHLVNQYRVSYFPNVADRFPGCPLTASRVGRFLASPYRPTYGHRFGQVGGAMAPSDGWEVFHRWFPRYGRGGGDADLGRRELPRLIARFERWMGGPFVNKNNHHCTRIPELSEWCPEARFVHLRRELAPTVASLLEARRANDAGLNDPWSVQPTRYVERRFEDELQQVVFTVLEARSEADRALSRLSDGRWQAIDYEEFCRDPTTLERWLEDSGADYRRRRSAPEAELSPSEREPSPEFRSGVDRWARRWREERDDRE